MDIHELVWVGGNDVHLAAHGISREEAAALIEHDDWVPYTHDDYPDQVRLVGSTLGPMDPMARLITLVVEPTGVPGVWRPVTGWPATDRERAYYFGEHV